MQHATHVEVTIITSIYDPTNKRPEWMKDNEETKERRVIQASAFSNLPKNGTNTRKYTKKYTDAACPINTYGFSTGWHPIHLKRTQSATRNQNSLEWWYCVLLHSKEKEGTMWRKKNNEEKQERRKTAIKKRDSKKKDKQQERMDGR
jgi:hypothetical protein